MVTPLPPKEEDDDEDDDDDDEDDDDDDNNDDDDNDAANAEGGGGVVNTLSPNSASYCRTGGRASRACFGRVRSVSWNHSQRR
jgi:hypothetical protein